MTTVKEFEEIKKKIWWELRVAGNYLSDPDDNNRIDFGCIHHSDYEEVQND